MNGYKISLSIILMCFLETCICMVLDKYKACRNCTLTSCHCACSSPWHVHGVATDDLYQNTALSGVINLLVQMPQQLQDHRCNCVAFCKNYYIQAENYNYQIFFLLLTIAESSAQAIFFHQVYTKCIHIGIYTDIANLSTRRQLLL